ncbi:hypothetical protein [Calothrix sp. PCC 6303]|uniref:hypothetical protein n=1 Tax=Calothrix sp. PCC 6303 TaxID=1170562 RepID=UPI0002A04ED8|nr:hypothetical protein [Calothrix sp. PCC 6303]AFZ00057.1 hypothetical protein Cal6303_0992 [Calothrix sp. PCC 6303]
MLRKIIVPTVVISGTVLACFSALLVLQGSKPVEIQMDNRQVFYGELKDVFTPPVAGLVSIAIAVTTATVIGCQQSLKESSGLQQRISALEQQISDRESEIEALKLAPESPVLAKLDWFLERDHFHAQQAQIETLPLEEVLSSFEPVAEPVVKANPGYEYQVITSNSASVQAATSMFATVQPFAGLNRRK